MRVTRHCRGDALFAEKLTGHQAYDVLSFTDLVFAYDVGVPGQEQVEGGCGFALLHDGKTGRKPFHHVMVLDRVQCRGLFRQEQQRISKFRIAFEIGPLRDEPFDEAILK